jgi:hypothetical protein
MSNSIVKTLKVKSTILQFKFDSDLHRLSIDWITGPALNFYEVVGIITDFVVRFIQKEDLWQAFTYKRTSKYKVCERTGMSNCQDFWLSYEIAPGITKCSRSLHKSCADKWNSSSVDFFLPDLLLILDYFYRNQNSCLYTKIAEVKEHIDNNDIFIYKHGNIILVWRDLVDTSDFIDPKEQEQFNNIDTLALQQLFKLYPSEQIEQNVNNLLKI